RHEKRHARRAHTIRAWARDFRKTAIPLVLWARRPAEAAMHARSPIEVGRNVAKLGFADAAANAPFDVVPAPPPPPAAPTSNGAYKPCPALPKVVSIGRLHGRRSSKDQPAAVSSRP